MNTEDLLGECAKVMLYSYARNQGEKRYYDGELCCEGDPRVCEALCKEKKEKRRREIFRKSAEQEKRSTV